MTQVAPIPVAGSVSSDAVVNTASKRGQPLQDFPAPRALFLDFGGVIFQTSKHSDGRLRYAQKLQQMLSRGGYDVPLAELESSITAGLIALKHWKHASSRRRTPREMGHREIVGDFLVSDLADGPRALLTAEAHQVMLELTTTVSGYAIRPGIAELLAEAAELGIPLVIVSNAHSGASHRRLIRQFGLEHYFVAQIYSDEVGIRKPNPQMLELAAQAAGVDLGEAWYVGDTMDRDVVPGRRAGIGAVFITASQHSANPPFAVADRPDAIFETPEGLLAQFRHSLSLHSSEPARLSAVASTTEKRPVLFLDHGGVISNSWPDEALLETFAREVSALLSSPDEPLLPLAVLERIARARVQHKQFKKDVLAHHQNSERPIFELNGRTFWVDYFGAGLSARQRTILRIEADQLTFDYGQAKSRREMRPGVRELLEAAQSRDVVAVVVSNTISGRAVRAQCAAHGLSDLIGAYVCSDEVGLRKPDPGILREAIAVGNADPARSIFVGDKPHNDAAVAQSLGIGHRVLVRGGSTPEAELAAALQCGQATDLVGNLAEVISLLQDNPTK